MRKPLLLTLLTTLALSVPYASAQPVTKPESKPMAPAMDMDKHMPHMQENMKKMQQQMDKIRKTTDPKERQKLMQEHTQAMQENMKMMRSMGGPMMTGSGQPGGTMMGKKDGMTDGDMMKRHEMMEKRMDMMQMMMEQMMQHDQMMQGTPTK